MFICPSEGSSKYEMVVDTNLIPYQLNRIRANGISWEHCTNAVLSTSEYYDFDTLQKLPENFIAMGFYQDRPNPLSLEGQLATDFKLKEISGDSLSLNDLNSKVLLIQFNGIGCGPCHASISGLKQLAEEYDSKDFEVISIECWSNNLSGIERYKLKNEMNYPLLISDEITKDSYQIYSVPVFFILDENRKIRKVIKGYGDSVGDEIKKLVEELI